MEGVGGEAVIPGFRFYPTEEELISFYLHHKLHGTGGPDVDRVIPVVDIYRHEPWDLPNLKCSGAEKGASEEQWFFFTAQQEREARGGKPNRSTATGYWKATGSPGWVYSTTTTSSSNNNVIGVKKTMVFYKGRAPFATKTPWKMNEYKAILHHNISDASSSSSNIDPPKLRHEMSVCRVYITSAGSSRAFDRRPLFLDAVTPSLPPPPHHHPQQQQQPLQELQSAQGNSSNTIGDDSINDDEDDELMITNGLQPLWEWERLNCP